MHLQSCSAHSRSISNNYCSVVKLAYLFTLVASEAFASITIFGRAETLRMAQNVSDRFERARQGHPYHRIGITRSPDRVYRTDWIFLIDIHGHIPE